MQEGHVRLCEILAVNLARPIHERSYYLQLCAVAQTGEALDVWHGSDKVNASRRVRALIFAHIREIRQILPRVIIESRLDGALFGDEIVCALDALSIQYSLSVACAHLRQLKMKIERRHIWHRTGREVRYSESYWHANCWNETRRSICIRAGESKKSNGQLQLNLSFPNYDTAGSIKFILINGTQSVRKLMSLHKRRGAQEAIFAQLKVRPQMDDISCRRRAVDQAWVRVAVMAQNLNHRLHMSAGLSEPSITKEPRFWWSVVHFWDAQHAADRPSHVILPGVHAGYFIPKGIGGESGCLR